MLGAMTLALFTLALALFMWALALFIFGGPVINDFAFTFVVGVIAGTYSSIYIAASLVLWKTGGEKPKLMTSDLTEEAPYPAEAGAPI